MFFFLCHDVVLPGQDQRPVRQITEAEREGWLGEVEGLQISLAGANDKLTQIDKRTRRGPVALGMSTHPADL